MPAGGSRAALVALLGLLVLTSTLGVLPLESQAQGGAQGVPDCPLSLRRGQQIWGLDEASSTTEDPSADPSPITTTCVYFHPPPENPNSRPGVPDVTFEIHWTPSGQAPMDASSACAGTAFDPVLQSDDRQALVTWRYTDHSFSGPDEDLLDAFERHAGKVLSTFEPVAAACPDPDAQPGTVTIEGRIGALDADKVWNPLPRVTVRVLLETPQGTEVVSTQTDQFGDLHVAFEQGPFVSYDIVVFLADADGVLRVRSFEGFAGNVISFKQTGRLFPVGNEDIRFREDIVLGGSFEGIVPVRIGAGGSVREDPVIELDELQDGAHVYHHLHKAAIFGAQALSLAYDHAMPVDVYLYGDGSSVFYRPSVSEIRLGQEHNASSVQDRSSPHNREYHEWGHHVHTDAVFGGTNRVPSRAPHDRNHGNVENFDTSDSLIEGFAVFYSMLVRDEPLYGLGGHLVNLEEGNVWTYGDTGYEEWEIASLLWDLMDEPDDGGFDRIALGVEGLWTLLQDDTIFTVRDLYERLAAQLGDRRTDPDDSYTDLDSLFVIHRFWDDDDRDGKADADEDVGYATYYRDTDPPRERSDVPEGISLQLTAEGPTGTPVPLEHVELTYLDAEGQVVTTSTARLDPGEPLLPLVLPGGTETFELQPRAPGFTAEPIVLEANETTQRMIAAAEAGEESFDAITARLSPSPAIPPTGVSAVASEDGTIEVRWDSPSRGEAVVVVRGIGGPPASPMEGEEVYRGTLNVFSEPGVVLAEHHYALFTLATDGSTSAPATVQAMPVDPAAGTAGSSDETSRAGGVSTVWILAGAGLLLGAYWVWTGRRGPPGPPPHAQGPMDAHPPEPPGSPPGPPPPG